jgi:hypothetical protein
MAICVLLFLISCKKDDTSSRQRVANSTNAQLPDTTGSSGTSDSAGTQSQEYDAYFSRDQAWDSLSSAIKFIRIQPTGPFVDFTEKTEVYLKTADSNTWEKLPYVLSQNINSTGNPVLFYSVKLEYDWKIPYSIVYIYAQPGASIDFSKTVSIMVRKYR